MKKLLSVFLFAVPAWSGTVNTLVASCTLTDGGGNIVAQSSVNTTDTFSGPLGEGFYGCNGAFTILDRSSENSVGGFAGVLAINAALDLRQVDNVPPGDSLTLSYASTSTASQWFMITGAGTGTGDLEFSNNGVGIESDGMTAPSVNIDAPDFFGLWVFNSPTFGMSVPLGTPFEIQTVVTGSVQNFFPALTSAETGAYYHVQSYGLYDFPDGGQLISGAQIIAVDEPVPEPRTTLALLLLATCSVLFRRVGLSRCGSWWTICRQGISRIGTRR